MAIPMTADDTGAAVVFLPRAGFQGARPDAAHGRCPHVGHKGVVATRDDERARTTTNTDKPKKD
jgi:hypothetical protein